MTTDMQPATSAAIRAELTAIGTRGSGLQRRQRRARVTASLIGVAAIAITTSAAALVAANTPGSTVTDDLGATTTVTRTGPALVDIGQAPPLANAVIVDITCLSTSGNVMFDTLGGTQSGVSCGIADPGDHMRISDAELPANGTTILSVDASPQAKWRAVFHYATSTTSDWGVNANGQTYGVENHKGHPDLVRARADNGQWGYVFWKESVEAEQPATVNVYKSDGHTVVGRQTASTATAPAVPFDQGLADDINSVATPTPTP